MAMFDLGQPLSIPLAGCPSVSTGLLHIPLIYLCQAEFGVVIVIKKQICKNDHEKKSNSVQPGVCVFGELREVRKTILNCTSF